MSSQPPIGPEARVPERVLVMMAHPDDIEFGAAGTVAKWTQQGVEVIFCLITNGAAGSNDPDAKLDELIKRRQEEQWAAAAVLGVTQIHFLGYADGVLQPTLELRRDLTRLIRQIKPDRVLAQDPSTIFVRDMYINHPDHRAAGEAAVYATFPSAETRPIFPELLEEGLEPYKVKDLYLTLTLEPNTFVDITDTMEHKIESLTQHKSQVTEERVREFVESFNAEMGAMVGVKYAEMYRVMKFYDDDDHPQDSEASA